MAIQISIAKSDLVSMLQDGFQTRVAGLERYVPSGQCITLVVTDGPFTVPAQVGGVNVLASKQVAGPGVLLAEWLTRGAG